MKINYSIDKKEVLRYRGHKGENVSPQLDSVTDEIIKKISSYVTSRFVQGRFSVTQAEDGVLLENGLLLQGQDIKKHLVGCDECYIICATVGTGADGFIRSMLALGSVWGLLADAAATRAVESLCDNVETQLRTSLKAQNSYLTWRYSPGYGDFPFTQQPDILALLKADKTVGVTCNDSCMMIPSKSVTAVMGIAKTKPAEKTHSCDRCPNKDNCNFSCR